jgi:3-hydroxyisobutyrate dehydrogenase
MTVRKVAFVGLGLMGSPMALRLLSAGFQVSVWNRTRSKLGALVSAGASAAESLAASAHEADAVCLCLSDRHAIEQVLFDPDGIASATQPPGLIVDFSTIGPEATRTLAGRLAERCGASWVDAPVSGGAKGAEQGKLVLFCGGSAGDIERLTPVLTALAQRVTRVGTLGAGQTLKLCNQLIVATNLVAIAESLALARSSGLDLAAIPDALTGGFADSLPLQIFGRRMAQGITTPLLGEISLMLKDLCAVDELARSHRSEMPMTAAALQLYKRAVERGLAHEDLAALLSIYPAH